MVNFGGNGHKKRSYFTLDKSGFFLTKKVTPIIGVFPSANFPQEKYFSPSNQFSPKKSVFPTLIQGIVMRFSEQTHSKPGRPAAKLVKMHVTNVLVV